MRHFAYGLSDENPKACRIYKETQRGKNSFMNLWKFKKTFLPNQNIGQYTLFGILKNASGASTFTILERNLSQKLPSSRWMEISLNV